VTTFLLVRHGDHDLLGHVLAGRTADIGLNARGRQQAGELAQRLRMRRVCRVLSSPLTRAQETAAPIASALGLLVETADELNEHDSGAWSGLSFALLERDPRWQDWNARRSSTRPPGGESMRELQARIVHFLRYLSRHRPNETLVLVSHCEPIRAALLAWRGIRLDDYAGVRVPAASINELPLASTPSSGGSATTIRGTA
jgi:broad specificity phosphatase PhoE